MPFIKNDSTQNSKTVTGIDLGPSLKNDSTGIIIGKKVEKKILDCSKFAWPPH
jgi:hypothetical protein